ncbi:hypothetical protein R83H12_01650 [Fibrobacteria bacterium R8-3-H12]
MKFKNLSIRNLCSTFAILCFGFQAAFAQCGSSLYPFAGGNGTENDPYQISTLKQLLDLEKCSGNDYQNNHYILNNDIDLTSYLTGDGNNGGAGWQPIKFSGKLFDGNGHKVSGLWINRASTDSIGLFRFFGEIKNIGVEIDDKGVKGRNYVGGLVGNGSTVSNSYVTGNVTGSHAGGLAGSASTISDSYATGNVLGADTVGGLVGYNLGTINNSYATGNVTGTSNVGGLVGINGNFNSRGTISNSYATGNVSGSSDDSRSVGGLVGRNDYGGTIINSYATGSVDGVNIIGGLAGYSDNGNISNSYATGSVTGNFEVGGLVGDNASSSISNSYATGKVTETSYGYGYVGGLVGSNNRSTITNSYATGNVTGTAYDCHIGGLVGKNENSTVSNSYATGNVTGTGFGSFGDVGGLVGSNGSTSTISNSYATGNVSGSSDDSRSVGGLVGNNMSSSISNSYATGNVTGTSDVGGLVGKNNNGTVSNSYYDMETSGMWDSDKGKGKTTAEMKTQNIYEGWDFVGVWEINPAKNNGYPALQPQAPTPIIPNQPQAPTPIIPNRENPIIGRIGVQTTSNSILLSNLPSNAKIEAYQLARQTHILSQFWKFQNFANSGSDKRNVHSKCEIWQFKQKNAAFDC